MKILYLTGGFFPKGTAYASRTLNLSRAMIAAGHDVRVIADCGETSCEDASNIIEGVSYYLCDSRRTLSTKKRVEAFCDLTLRSLREDSYDLVISSSDHDRFSKIFRIVRMINIPIVLESCEWFGSYNWTYGLLNPRYYRFLYCWRKFYPKVDGVITISRLLENHYRQYTKNVVRIPTVLPEMDWDPDRTSSDEYIRLIYAGSAGKSKDLLKNVILAISMLKESDPIIKLDIYGVDKPLVKMQLGKKKTVLDALKDRVFVHGKIRQDEIHSRYCKSDYSILFRPKRRSSNAGFPTKLAESLMAGVPVICNDTGDVGLYVKDSFNGIIIDETTPEEIYKRLSRLSLYQTSELRKHARNTAVTSFLWKNYSDKIDQFIKTVVRSKNENN